MKKTFLALIATAALSLLAEATALSSAEQEGPGISRLRSKCDNNNTLACVNLAMAYYSGDGVKQDYEKAKELNSKACNLGDGWGCTTLGASYEYGKGAEQDYKKATELYSKACDLKNSIACGNLGVLYYSGKGVKQDYKKSNRIAFQSLRFARR